MAGFRHASQETCVTRGCSLSHASQETCVTRGCSVSHASQETCVTSEFLAMRLMVAGHVASRGLTNGCWTCSFS